MFLTDILEAFHAYDPISDRFLKEKTFILIQDVDDRSRGIQLIGPACLQKELGGRGWGGVN